MTVLSSAVHRCPAKSVSSRYIRAAFYKKEHNLVVAVLRGRLKRGDAVIFNPYLIGVLSCVKQPVYLKME